MFSKDKIKDNAIITTAAFSPFIMCFGLPAWGLWVGWNIGKYKSEKRQLSHGGRYIDPMTIGIHTNALIQESDFHKFEETDYDGIPFSLFRTKEMYEDCMQLVSPFQLEKDDKVIWKRKILNSETGDYTYVYHFLSVNGLHSIKREDERRLNGDLNKFIKCSIDIDNPYKDFNGKPFAEAQSWIEIGIKNCMEQLERKDITINKKDYEERFKNRIEEYKTEYYHLNRIVDEWKDEINKKWEAYKEFNLPPMTFYVLGGFEGNIPVPTCEWENIRLYKKGEPK